MRTFFTSFLLVFSMMVTAQGPKPIKLTGTVIDSETNQPLEYATIILQEVRNPDKITGGITDNKGKFTVEAPAGQYNIKVEFISFKSYELKNQALRGDKDMGVIKLALDVAQLDAVEVIAERTTVELRMDKKIYNVGQDMTVKGGSVTDVLDNVPSVSVDVEGNISLRGNENVRILINGKPSALSGLSPDALQQLPADAIEKIELITNPSARYDAEGTAGIINIILKKGKGLGVNGALSAFAGNPDNFGGSLNLNLRGEKINIFTNTSYRYSDSPGNSLFEQINYNQDGTIRNYQDEYRKNNRINDNFNTNLGVEFIINESTSLTNSFVYRKRSGENNTNVNFFNFDANKLPTIQRNRFTLEDDSDESVQYSLNFEKRFNEHGHKLTFDYQYSTNNELEDSNITELILNDNNQLTPERTINNENVNNQLLQFDYVLPFGENKQSQFELGYRGNFNDFDTDFQFGTIEPNGDFTLDNDFTNRLLFKENINALYTQFGTRFGKFNLMSGLRMEDTNIDIRLVNTNDINKKKYTNWFPSVFLGYEFSETEQFTVSYSKRLRRPWSRFINPFPSRTSNTNLFQGNPDLDPTFTDAYDIGYLKRWDKITLNTSAYYNRSTGVFQFIALETGDFVEIENPDTNEIVDVPIMLRTPINLAVEQRLGVEFTTTYTPKRNWRFTWNINLFNQKLDGDYTYINYQDEEIVQNFDSENFTWFSRLSSKIVLPYKIDFQANMMYQGPNRTAQSKSEGMLSANLAFSKDILKDKGTLSLNVSDLFNSRKRISETRTPTVFSYSEMQWRQRQVTLNFTYRFNKQKEREMPDRMREGGGEDFDFEG